MAREIFTIVRKHGEKDFVAVLGPETPMSEHRQFIKQFRLSKEHPHVAEVIRAVPVFRVKLKQTRAGRRRRGEPSPALNGKKPEPKPVANGTSSTLAGRIRSMFGTKVK